MTEHFQFAQPEWLYVLPFILCLIILRRRRGAEGSITYPTVRFISSLARNPQSLAGKIGAICFVLAAAALAIALARPQKVEDKTFRTVNGIDIMIAFDLSYSMETPDMVLNRMPINRLVAAKHVITQFVDSRPDDRIGIVGFAGKTKSFCPLTLDHALVNGIIRDFHPRMIQADGTAIGSAIAAAATRLEAVAESLSSLAETVNEVYDALPHRCETFRWVIDNAHDALCFNCGRRESCWKQEYTATLDGMNALRPILERNGHLETGDLPAQLGRCIHPAALCAAVNKAFALYRSRKETRVHAEAMRTALTEQYSAVADALGVLSEQLGRPGTPEPYKSGRVADFFASLGTPPLESAVTLDDLGRTRAAVTLPRTRFSAPELAALAQEVGRLCRRTFDPPQVLSCKGMTTLLFCEKPALRAVFGSAGSAARGSISGDAVQQFCSPTAAQMILCDGMGTGRPAAVDGNLAAELTARLLKAGFTAELAARLVNVALALKSDEESGATLDLISVDLYTGTARLFKAGAAPGFLVHGGRARPVGDASLPIGILGGVNGQSRVVHLAAGDYAVLVSDGLLVDGTGWVLKQLELSAAAADPPEVLAKTLVETARARAEATGRPDDITAAVLRLEACGR